MYFNFFNKSETEQIFNFSIRIDCIKKKSSNDAQYLWFFCLLWSQVILLFYTCRIFLKLWLQIVYLIEMFLQHFLKIII